MAIFDRLKKSSSESFQEEVEWIRVNMSECFEELHLILGEKFNEHQKHLLSFDYVATNKKIPTPH